MVKEKQENENVHSLTKEVLTLGEAADFLGYSRSTIYKFTSAGKIPYSKRNGSIRFLRSTLISWIKSGEKQTVTK